MTEERKIQLVAEVDTTRTRAGFNEIGQQAGTMANTVTRAGQQAQAAIGGIGNGADQSAGKVEVAGRNLIQSIQRTTAATEAGSRSTAAYFESLARERGVDPAVLQPFLTRLREVEAAQVSATLAQTRATEAARAEAQALREVAQATAGRESFIASLREQIALFGKSSEEVLKYRAAQAGAAESAAPLILQLKNVTAAHEAVTRAAKEEALAQQKAVQVQNGRDSFIASLQQQANAIGKTRTQLLELQAAEMGVTAQAAPLIARLREAEGGMGNLGMSAKATASVLRTLPAQVTDIVTSLQGGQAPLTVLLQQGGQLKDMFGGVGAAAKALGGYVVGLLNPFTIAAAAAVVLATAYHEGAIEAEAHRRAIILSGNAAGTSANQLSNLSRSIGQTIGTQGAAAEALDALVATGRVSAKNLEQFGTTAVIAQRALGQSVGDTAAQFAELGRSPLAALEKLNEQYHFLAPSVYAAVKALEMQGRTLEAGAMAQKAYADSFDGVTKGVTDNLGSMQKFWNGVKDASKDAWDGMLNIGRADTLEQQLESVRAKIKKAQGPFDAGFDGNASARGQLKQNLEIESSLVAQIASNEHIARIKGEQAEFNAADLAWSKDSEKYLTRKQQYEVAIEANRNRGLAAGISDEEMRKRALLIEKSFADVVNKSTDAQLDGLRQRVALQDILAKRALDQIGFLRTTEALTNEQAVRATTEVELDAMSKRRAGMVAELALIKQKQDSEKDQRQKQGEIAAADAEIRSRRIKGENDLIALQQARLRLSDELNEKGFLAATGERDGLLDSIKAQKEYNEQIGLDKRAVAALQEARLNGLATLKDESAGAIEALEPGSQLAQLYREQADALRERGKLLREGAGKEFQFDGWKKAVDTYSDVFRTGFADMLSNGKDGWKSFTKSLVTTFKTSVADQIYKMFAQPFVVQLVSSFTGSSGTAAALSSMTSAGSSGGGAGSAASLISMGKTIYSGFSSGIATSLGGMVTQLGTTFGSTAVSTFGAGISMGPAGAAAAAELAGGAAGATTGAAGAASAGAGASAGAYAIPIAGWIAAGMALSNGLYKSGWDSNNGQNKDPLKLTAPILAFDSILRKIGLSPSVANIFSGQATVARLFGRKAPAVENAGIEGTFGSSGFTGDTYQNILEKGGVFRSDKRYTKTAALDEATDGYFDGAIKSLMASVKGFGEVLGLPVAQIDGYTKAIKLTLTDDEAKNKEAITKVFSGIGDDLTSLLVPTIAQFSEVATEFGASGESASATLQRIVTDYTVIDAALSAIGDTFGAVGLDSVAARERLLELTGGLEAFSKGAAYFSQNYLSEAERLAPVAKTVDSALAAMGLSLVTTREQFKDVVLGLDLTSESGAKTYASLMGIQEQFALLHPAIDATTDATTDAIAAQQQAVKDQRQELQDQLDALTMTQAQMLAKKRGQLDPANVDLFDQINQTTVSKEAAEALAASVQAAADALAATNKGYSDQIDALLKSTMSASELRALETAGMDRSTLALYERLEALKGEAAASKIAADAIETAKQAAIVSAKAQADFMTSIGSGLADTMKKATDAAKALRSFNDSLLLGNLSPLDPEARYQEAKRAFSAADGTDTSAATAFLQAAKDRDAGSFSYQRDFAAVQAKLLAGASAQDSLAASIPAFYRSVQAMFAAPMSVPHTPMPAVILSSLAPAQTYSKSDTAPIDSKRLEDAIDALGERLTLALAPIADATGKAAGIQEQLLSEAN